MGIGSDAGSASRRRLNFGEVQADGLNLDDCLAGPCFWIWNILIDQAFWPAWLVYAYCFHGNPPQPMNPIVPGGSGTTRFSR